MRNFIKIAGISIEISSEAPFKMNRKTKVFSTSNSEHLGLKVFLQYNENIIIPEKALLIDDNTYWNNGKGVQEEATITIYNPETKQVTNQLIANKQWNHAVLLYHSSHKNSLNPFFEFFGEILFRNCLLFHQGMVIHAAAIEWYGKGILFSAPSGTGKTTQANLWRKYKGAKIINADRPAIRVIGKDSYVYGTLWNGSSKKCSNLSVPLVAIVLIEQCEGNVIHKLEKKEAIEKLMPRCFLPYYQEDLMNLALSNIEQILNQVPVYLLKCRPDREAVELVYQCVK
ncbi:MAG: hypothetical protein K0S41_2695 [Anaerocolumna sp.]|jgi:hypothetical protein|nr:hypothetical protein [Anaerocolumna sp.]